MRVRPPHPRGDRWTIEKLAHLSAVTSRAWSRCPRIRPTASPTIRARRRSASSCSSTRGSAPTARSRARRATCRNGISRTALRSPRRRHHDSAHDADRRHGATARSCSGTAARTACGRRRSGRSRARSSTAARAPSTRSVIADALSVRLRARSSGTAARVRSSTRDGSRDARVFVQYRQGDRRLRAPDRVRAVALRPLCRRRCTDTGRAPDGC